MRCEFGSPFEDSDQQAFERHLTTFPDIRQTFNENGFKYHVASQRSEQPRSFAAIRLKDVADDSECGLNRCGTFRLDLHVGTAAYESMFGALPPRAAGAQTVTGTSGPARDNALMPHPTRAADGWVSIVNPTQAKLRKLIPMIEQVYRSARQQAGLNTN